MSCVNLKTMYPPRTERERLDGWMEGETMGEIGRKRGEKERE